MRLKRIVTYGLALTLSLMLFSCAAPKHLSYLEEVSDGMVFSDSVQVIKVQPGDKLTIITKSKDPLLSELFNLPVTSYRVGSVNSSYSQQIACYSVTSDGYIDFPILGEIQVVGMTREQIAQTIKQKLISSNLVKDPVITVEFENLHFSVLGEVNNPGQYTIDHDKITLLDALGKAGDLTIYGRRDNVLVMRQSNGETFTYRVNLNNADSLLNSPVAYLQQNDVVYVDPNNVRKRQSTVNGNNVLSASFWVSVASLITSIVAITIR